VLNFHRTWGALATTVPAEIMIVPVSVILTIVNIMFILITHQVVEGESVMTGEKVNGVERPPTVRLI
jgi:hypothetical protein